MRNLRHTVKNTQIRFALGAVLCLPALCPAQTVPTYTITTVAGNSTLGAGYSGDSGQATAAQLDGPTSVFVDAKGNIYIADSFNARIRLVTASSGVITTVVGNGTAGFLGDACGVNCGTVVETAVNSEISGPDTVIVDSKGNIYIADTANDVVRLVPAGGASISTYAGQNSLGFGFSGDGGLATVAQLDGPAGLALDSAGNLFISDNKNNRIRKVIAAGATNAGVISTIVDFNGNVGFDGNGGIANTAHINGPRGMAIDSTGALYFADSGSNMIRKVTPPAAAGTITLVAGSPTDLPGVGAEGVQATTALLHGPQGVAVDTCGNVYIADTTNSRIRIVTTNGIINTIAGGNGNAFSGDGGPALSAQLNFPASVAVDAQGNVYVADTQNGLVRKLTPTSAAPCGGAPPAITASPKIGVISASAYGGSASIGTGSWIEIYGSNLAADTRSWAASDFSGTPAVNAPTSLDRTAVTIAGQSAFVDYISPCQVNAQVPANTGTGPLPVTVSTAAGTSTAVNVTVNAVQPGLWAPPQFNVGGTQYVGATHADGTFVGPAGAFTGLTSSPAKPGEVIVLYGIGFGSVGSGTPPGQITQTLNTLVLPIQFSFSGVPTIAPAYDGLAPNYVGLYQFNLTVPASLANSNAVPVTFTLGSGANAVVQTQTMYIAVQN